MIYRNNALSFSLLLGAGGIVISTAVSLPYHDRRAVDHKGIALQLGNRAMHKQRSRLRRDVPQVISRSILDDLTGSPDETQDNKSDIIDSGAPVGAAGIDLNDPVGSITGWLNHEERIYNTLGLEGELDLIAPSDEKPTGIKVAALGYTPAGSTHSPFELWSEKEAGSVVFLTPPGPTFDQTEERLDSGTGFSNHSAAMLAGRSVSFGLGILPRLNLTGVDSANASGSTEPSGFVHVLIKAGSPSNPGTLCTTFYARSAPNRGEDDSPMVLERCDDALIPGSPTGLDGLTATQLWQYDPKTRELRPVLKGESGMSGDNTQSSASHQNYSVAPDVTIRGTTSTQPLSSSTEGTRTTASQSVAVARQTQSHTSNSITPTYSPIATPSQVKIRRAGSRRAEVRDLLPSFTAVEIVEPYTLVFTPRITSGTGTTLPDSPV